MIGASISYVSGKCVENDRFLHEIEEQPIAPKLPMWVNIIVFVIASCMVYPIVAHNINFK